MYNNKENRNDRFPWNILKFKFMPISVFTYVATKRTRNFQLNHSLVPL